MRPEICIKITFCLAVMISTAVHGVGNDRAKMRDKPIDTIVLHTIGGPYCKNGQLIFSGAPGGAEKWKKFFELHPSVSIHYIIDRQGHISKSIDEAKVAWHAKGKNATSIGIELVNDGDGIEPFAALQIATLSELVKAIKVRHVNIKNNSIIRHSDVDKRTFKCAGKRAKLKQDPGPQFPFKSFIKGL
jgi:N-acetyl-anhydromuramyl-L-alanine amidase AmpD